MNFLTPHGWLLALAAVLALTFGAVAWRYSHVAAHERELRLSVERQAKADTAVTRTSDKAASDVRVIVQTGAKEVQYVQTLPGADTPIDAARRAAVCGSLGRVFNDPGFCTSVEPDGKPESGMSDANRPSAANAG